MNLKALIRSVALASLFLFSIGLTGCSDLLVDSAESEIARTSTEGGTTTAALEADG